VEERDDGKNVNAWHWEERDCSKWCRERLDQCIGSIDVVENDRAVKVSKVTKMEGEVNWYNRKGKLFTLYDLSLSLDFVGKRGDEAVTGTIKISEFEQDNEQKAGFRLSLGTGTADEAWKTWARDVLKKHFIDVWSRVIVDLHEDQKARLPALANNEAAGKIKLPEVIQKAAKAEAPVASVPVVSSITLAHTFQASVQDLWDLFLNPRKVEHFTQSKVMLDPKEGGLFQLYDGVITGCFLELKPNTEMRFAWRLKDWKQGINSQVTVKFVKSSGGTKVELVQTNIPADDVERTRQGWTKYYFERWRGIFGYSFQ
jgi:activator of HSP90 ATPase